MINPRQVFKDLQDNLSTKCCGKFNLKFIPNGVTEIKLYDRRSDACEENTRFKWYDISKIHANNTINARPTAIVCYKCPENGKCIISLRIAKKNTRFAVIDKIV